MTKTRLLMAAAAVAFASVTPALAADSVVSAEYRIGTGKGPQASQYVLDYQAPFFQVFPNLNYGVGVETKQQPNDGANTTKLGGRVGIALPEILGVTLGGNVQLGKALEASTSSVVAGKTVVKGGDYNWYGVELKASRPLIAGFSVDTAYRYRDGFEHRGFNNQETRVAIGVSYEILPSWNAGVEYYRYTQGANPVKSNALFSQIGVKVKHDL